MIDGLKPYPKYKDSGVAWLGDVPGHWEVLPALAAYRPRQVKNTGMIETTVLSLSYGRIIVKPSEKLRGLVPESFETYQIVDPGNIIVRTTDLQNDHTSLRIGHAQHRGIITSAYMCLETTKCMSNEFGYQFLNAYDLLKVIYGFGSGLRQNLDLSDIKRMPVLVPPIPEQAAIVRFLDHADRRIRRYIRAKQKLIKLLEEQKQAFIHGAVTRGLDPKVRLKPSGVEWLGDVPEHWVVASLRFRYHQCLGKMVDAKRETGNYPVPYLRNVDVQWDRINTADLPQIDIAPGEHERYTVKSGDLLVCEGRHLGRAAFWRGDFSPCAFQKALHRLRARNPRIDAPRWLFYCLYVVHFQDAFGASSHDNSIPHLTGEMLRAHKFPFPSFDEQTLIAAYIDEKVADIDQARALITCEIERVLEYRSRLIADVVTGKLDVREAAWLLPDESEESEPLNEADPEREDVAEDNLDTLPEETLA